MIITFLYIFSSAISLALGSYCISSDYKRKENKIFFILTLTISFWAFDYALMNISTDINIATFLHRIGSIFYSIFYSIFLHFIVILTKNEKQNNNKKYTQIFFIYLPALISLVLYFFISPVKVEEHFRTPLGWGHLNSETTSPFIVHYHTLYYLSCTIIALILLFIWKRKTSIKKEKKQAILLIIGIFCVLFLGVITDTVFPSIRLYPLPPMGSIELMIPIIFAWVAIKRYSLMLPHINLESMTFLKSLKVGIFILDNKNNIVEISNGALILLGINKKKN